MPAQRETSLPQPRLPAGTCADPDRVGQQSVLLFLEREAGELLAQRMLGMEERLLAVQDRRVGALGVLVAL